MKYFTDENGNLYDENQDLIAKAWDFSSDENWNIELKNQTDENPNWMFEIKESAFSRLSQAINICFKYWKVLLIIPFIYRIFIFLLEVFLFYSLNLWEGFIVQWLSIIAWIFMTLWLIYSISQIDKVWEVTIWNALSYANNNLLRYLWIIFRNIWFIAGIPIIIFSIIWIIYLFIWNLYFWWLVDTFNLSDFTALINWEIGNNFSIDSAMWIEDWPSIAFNQARSAITLYVIWLAWLLTIPFMIYRSVKVFASMFITVSENKEPKESIIESVEITKWNWWIILWNSILITIVSALIGYISWILSGWILSTGSYFLANFIAIPFQSFAISINTIFIYLLYKVLKKKYLIKS